MTGKQEIFYKAYTRLIYPGPEWAGLCLLNRKGGKELPVKLTGLRSDIPE
jgi:hypothetical protein